MSDAVTKKDLDELAIQIVQLLEPRFNSIEERINALDSKLDHLTETLDVFLKRLDDIEIDNHDRDVQIARLESWIESIAQKTGVKLEY